MWSWPPAWPIGHLVLASELNTYIRDNLGETGVAAVTTAGDLIVGNGANDVKRLGIGSEGQVLEMAAGAAGWATAGEQEFASDDTTLTDLTATGDPAQWGTEETQVADPGQQVTVIGFLCGQASILPVNQTRSGFVVVQYSTDGGSTWTSLEQYQIDQYVDTSAFPYHYVTFPTYLRQTTPTGEIQLRVLAWEGPFAAAVFTAGRLACLVLGDT